MSTTLSIDWRTPLPQLVAALVALGPGPHEAPGLREEGARKLSRALALASAQVSSQFVSRVECGQRPAQRLDKLPQVLLKHVLGLAGRTCAGMLKCACTICQRAARELWPLRMVCDHLLPRDQPHSLRDLQAVLKSRKEFGNITALHLPLSVRLGVRGVASICETCPQLQLLDLGYMCSGSTGVADDAFTHLVNGLPQLCRIRLPLRKMSRSDAAGVVIGSLADSVGGRLTELRLEGPGCALPGAYFADADISLLAARCPALRVFALHYEGGKYEMENDLLIGKGLTSLIAGCPKLEELELGLTARVGLEPFVAMAAHLDAGTSALQHVRTYGILALEGSGARALRERLAAALRTFTLSEDSYRELLRSVVRGRSSIFVPSVDYLRTCAGELANVPDTCKP